MHDVFLIPRLVNEVHVLTADFLEKFWERAGRKKGKKKQKQKQSHFPCISQNFKECCLWVMHKVIKSDVYAIVHQDRWHPACENTRYGIHLSLCPLYACPTLPRIWMSGTVALLLHKCCFFRGKALLRMVISRARTIRHDKEKGRTEETPHIFEQ